MNTVEALIDTPFSSLSLAEKLRIKEMGPHTPPLKMQSVTRDRDRVYTRKFTEDWYGRKSWLCGSVPKDALFCFPCLLFGGENLWTRIGMRDLKHFTQKITKHEQSKKHLDNVMKLCILGKTNIAPQLDEEHQASIIRHNQEVDNNRHVLSRIIDSIRLCAATQSALRGPEEFEESLNPGMFRGLIDYIASLEAAVQPHFQEMFRGTSKTIQNELLDCMLTVARNQIKDELKRTSFVAIEVDDITDVSTSCQNVLIFRYIKDDGSPVERFYSFFQLENATAETIAETLLRQLEEVLPGTEKVKLIAQSYDGANVMRGERGGVQRKIQSVYPHAHYVHCFAHQLNLVMKNVSSVKKEVRVFFQNLSGFPTYFSHSAKRTEFLTRIVKHIAPTRWNFHVNTISMISEKRQELIACFRAIEGLEDDDTGFLTQSLLRLLEGDKEFLYWLLFFNKIMPHVDFLYHKLQSRLTDPAEVQECIRDFESNINTTKLSIWTLFDELPPEASLHRSKSKEQLDQVALEVCDLIIRESQERFSFTGHLSCARLLDPSLFHTHSRNFPDQTLDAVIKAYPMLERARLKTELTAMYEAQELYTAKGALEILQLLTENNMKTSFLQLVKLLQIVITTPLPTAETEHSFSTLKRVKTFLRSTVGEQRLNALAMLSAEEQMIKEIPHFNTQVMEEFAAQKERRAKFMYKK